MLELPVHNWDVQSVSLYSFLINYVNKKYDHILEKSRSISKKQSEGQRFLFVANLPGKLLLGL